MNRIRALIFALLLFLLVIPAQAADFNVNFLNESNFPVKVLVYRETGIEANTIGLDKPFAIIPRVDSNKSANIILPEGRYTLLVQALVRNKVWFVRELNITNNAGVEIKI